MMLREEAVKKLYKIDTTDRTQVESLIDEIYNSIGADSEAKNPWAWVKTEYVVMFKAKNPEKGGYIKESEARLKAMFRERPEIRKEDVIETTKYYLSQTDSRFIRQPHYFLKKGVGVSAIYEFATWYEKYQQIKELGKGRNSSTNTMQ